MTPKPKRKGRKPNYGKATPEQVAKALHRYRPVKKASSTSTPSRRQPRQQDRTPPP